MASGLDAFLSPDEEILLRRVALGSDIPDTRKLGRLCGLALVQHIGGSWRLTPLGRQRFDLLPKALVFQKRRLPLRLALEATLDKYRQQAQAPIEARTARRSADKMPSGAPPAPISFERAEWKLRAERHLLTVRDQMGAHQHRQIALMEGSERCIRASRQRLKASLPRLPVGTLLASARGASDH